MKKNNFKRIIALISMATMFLILAACGNNKQSGDKDYEHQQTWNQENLNASRTKWDIKINGKSVILPCTLDDLSKIGVNIYGKFDKENVLNSTNETFTMVAATYGEDDNPIYLKIVVGDEADKKEANATVRIITNTNMDSSLFKLKNGIALGSSIDEVISTFGDDYNMSRAMGDDIHSGYVVINYGTKADGAMFCFQDGVLKYIEILADKGE